MSVAEERERPGGVTIFALFLLAGLIAFGYVWVNVHQRWVGSLSSSDLPMLAHTILGRWLHHGFFASYGLVWPTPDEKIIYRSFTGGFMISSFVAEKVWMAMTGRYGWQLLAFHNEVVALLIATLLALFTYRLARPSGPSLSTPSSSAWRWRWSGSPSPTTWPVSGGCPSTSTR